MSGYPPAGPSSHHRHTNSTSSRTSQGSGRSSGRDLDHNPAVESAVTRLLVAIKQLLEALTQWSIGRITENDVSDVYVRLGNDFNAAVAAFNLFNIDMSELMSVPDELRNILETCLAEEASPAVLDIYLPDVRKVITSLLQGLRAKQSIYRRSRQSTSNRTSDSLRTSSRTSRTGQDHPRSSIRERDPQSSGSTRRREAVTSDFNAHTAQPSSNDEEVWAGGFAPSQAASTSLNEPAQSASYGSRRHPPNGSSVYPTHGSELQSVDENETFVPPSSPPPVSSPSPVPQAPPNVTRYSLSDPPLPASPPPVAQLEGGVSVTIDGPATPGAFPADSYEHIPSDSARPTTPSQLTEQETGNRLRTPAIQSSLAALKSSDALERRASKRFSTYTFSKITGSRDAKGSLMTLEELTGSEERRNRRSVVFPNANLTPGDLESLAEEDESPMISPNRNASLRKRSNNSASPRRQQRGYSPGQDAPPVPPIPDSIPSVMTPEAQNSEASLVGTVNKTAPDDPSSSPLTPDLQVLTVFLRVGLQVKKVTLERDGLSIPSLRLQFTEKFSYNPGMENFPAIYINDPSSQIQYELEDMDEIQDKSLLSLNIEPLDQIKQHIDLQISSLAQDIKDLKTTVNSNRRQSLPLQAPTVTVAQSTMSRPTEGQFANMARRVADRLSIHADETPRRPRSPLTFGPIVAQMTGNSVAMSDMASARIVSDLKTQFDEVQNLRRDLGVMRQLYTDFMSQTKDSLSTLRSQTTTVRQLAATKVGGERAYIDSGKANMDTRSQNVLTKVEELQDTVETLKHDVLKRHVSPKPTLMHSLKADIESTAKELESLTQHIQTVKPMWKKTWEEELQNIVEEQQFLSYQEEFMTDLLEDHKALVEVYGHIEQVITLRGTSGSGRLRTYRPPPMDEGHNGLSTVMLEIRSAAVDPERRLKAIAASQKNREKEMASRSDEFQAELNGFVQGKKLKLTGGAEEVERIRQKRNDMALRQMFNQAPLGSDS
ncbi:AIP3-domain-containing protein [Hysterangium stoloniferum]|nr:AIP3-domain-containing protein [Hysterangium stoloniferum]